MGCTPTGFKTFLVVCNVGLLFTGLSILIIGVKMKSALVILLKLVPIPILLNAVKAVIATGFVITLTGGSGISGACYEVLWLLIVHVVGLGIIVVMEFSLGVTLMVVKNTVESTLETLECTGACAVLLNAIVLDHVMPSAGLMMTIIVFEALMVYSAVKMYFYLRDKPKDIPQPAGTSVVVQNVQMQNVAAPTPQPMYAPPPQPTYTPQPQHPMYPPQPQPQQQPMYSPQPPQQPTYPPHPSQPPHQPIYSNQPQPMYVSATQPPYPAQVPPDTSESTPPPYVEVAPQGVSVQMPDLPKVELQAAPIS